jgi:osmotically-inducible protein OsmY
MRPPPRPRTLLAAILEGPAMTERERHAPRELHDAIRAALQARCANAVDRVRIDNDASGCVTIEGEVADWPERELVQEVIAGVPGVTRVDCRLIVDT